MLGHRIKAGRGDRGRRGGARCSRGASRHGSVHRDPAGAPVRERRSPKALVDASPGHFRQTDGDLQGACGHPDVAWNSSRPRPIAPRSKSPFEFVVSPCEPAMRPSPTPAALWDDRCHGRTAVSVSGADRVRRSGERLGEYSTLITRLTFRWPSRGQRPERRVRGPRACDRGHRRMGCGGARDDLSPATRAAIQSHGSRPGDPYRPAARLALISASLRPLEYSF